MSNVHRLGTMMSATEFIGSVIAATIFQMLIFFGPLLLVGFLISIFEGISNKRLMRTFGPQAGIGILSRIGTTVHETGHALFCIIFRHKIIEFVPFRPQRNPGGGLTLGYVRHSSRGTLWNRIGNLFIGTGPIIIGSAVIALLIRFLLPGGSGFFGELNSSASGLDLTPGDYGNLFLDTARITMINVFWGDGWKTFLQWQFWVFVLIASSISLHMSLSPSDLKGAGYGVLFFTLLLFLVNIVVVALDRESYTATISTYLMFCAGILFVGAIFSIITMVGIFVFTTIFRMIRR